MTMIEITYTCDFCNKVIDNWRGKVGWAIPNILKDLDRYDACPDCLNKARIGLENTLIRPLRD